MKDYFLNLFSYNSWANSRAIESLQEIESEKILGIMSHILDAQLTWLVRIKDSENASRNFWNLYSVDEMKSLSEISNKNWEDFIGSISEDDLKNKISYTNSKGENYSNTIAEILTHVINHSSYPRGQIASLIRMAGGEPALTDFIVYSR